MERHLLTLLSTVATATAARARIHEFEGIEAWDSFGVATTSVADFDGDGLDDLLIGRPEEIAAVCSEQGSPGFQIRSGVDGSMLFERTSTNHEHLGSPLARLGDVDGDGVDEFTVGSGGDPDCWDSFTGLRVYSGANGSELYQIPTDIGFNIGAYWVMGLPDVDSDGVADLAVFYELENFAGGSFQGEVEVLSGVDGSRLWWDRGANSHDRLGAYSAPLGDWNGDGIGDLAVGALTHTRVYDSTSGVLLARFPFPGELADPGDFDGDGLLDLVIENRLISGANGAELAVYPGWKLLVPAEDVTLDGTLDFVAGDPAFAGHRGRAGLVSGASGSQIWAIREGANPTDRLGQRILALPDVSGDGHADLLLSAPYQSGTDGTYETGRVWLYSMVGWPPPQVTCIAAANSASPIGAPIYYSNSWSIANNDLSLNCTYLPPNHFGRFFYGPTSVQMPFGNGFRCAGGFVNRLLPPLSSGDAGEVTRVLDFTVPPLNSISAGMTRWFQYWYRDVPAGGAFFNLSDALGITFSP